MQTLFSSGSKPSRQAYAGDGPYCVGVVIVPDSPGLIQAIRYYRTAEEEGTGQVGMVLDEGGRVLVSTTAFETANCSGAWVSAPLAHPLPTEARVRYTVVVDQVTSYAATDEFHITALRRGALMAPRNGGRIGKAGEPPGRSPMNRTYWVDGTSDQKDSSVGVILCLSCAC